MRTTALLGGLAAMALASLPAQAGDTVVKVGVLTDLTSFASTSMGEGSVVASRLAAQNFGGTVIGKKIEVLSADMQSKPDLAVQLAQQWYDVEGVDVIVDVPASAAAITIQRMAFEKHRLFLATVAATTELTGKSCSPTGVQWGVDTAAESGTLINAVTQEGARSWFFIMPDFAVGKSLAAVGEVMVKRSGAKLIETVYHPTNSTDYAQYLLRAQQSGADAIGVGSIGLDLTTLIKQANEFAILPKQKLGAFLMQLTDIDSVGLQTTQGVYVDSDFYWDDNDQTRAFAKQFFEIRHKMPNATQAANYSGVTAYLTAIKEAGSDDPVKVVAKMREHPMSKFGAKATLREDGRIINDVGLYQVKSPAESKAPWDYMKRVRTIPGDKVFLTLEEGGCPLIKK
ncbi:MAG TPA: ABC transporter substrate-binding protein [Stellaceae bacterium]|nr:ABC transporter substrate-binding protein [Stellaceae bacterium]